MSRILKPIIKQILQRVPGAVFSLRLSRQVVAIIGRSAKGVNRNPSLIMPGILDLSNENENWFCGYYDHSPFNSECESHLLIHSTCHPAWKKPSSQKTVTVVIYDWKKKKIVNSLGETTSWNWQQGARAMWLGPNKVIFNIYDAVTNSYRARIVNSEGRHLEDLKIPVQEIDSLGRVYSISYDALTAFRPDYGYRNRSFSAANLIDNAIEQYDPSTGKHRTLVQLTTLLHKSMSKHDSPITKPKFNHVMASPSGAHLVFLFRYFVRGRRVTDLYEVSTDSGEHRLLVADKGVSHICWWNDDTVVATLSGADGFGYYLVPINGQAPALFWVHPDGHPNRLGQNKLLTDTYPDRYGLRHLLIRSPDTGGVTDLGVYPEPLLFQGETRCDLHPSISPSGRYIQVDCALRHRRTVAIIENPDYRRF